MDGVNTTWGRVKGGTEIGKEVEDIQKNFDPNHPDKSVEALLKAYGQVKKITDAYWRVQKSKELSEIIAACSGLWAEAYATDPTYARGEMMTVHSQMISRYGLKISLDNLKMMQTPDNIRSTINDSIAFYGPTFPDNNKTFPANELQTYNMDYPAAQISQPYWLESPHPIGSYTINNEKKVGSPKTHTHQLWNMNS